VDTEGAGGDHGGVGAGESRGLGDGDGSGEGDGFLEYSSLRASQRQEVSLGVNSDTRGARIVVLEGRHIDILLELQLPCELGGFNCFGQTGNVSFHAIIEHIN